MIRRPMLTAMLATAVAGCAWAEGIALPAPPTRPTPGPVIESRPPQPDLEEALAAEIYDLTSNRPQELEALIKEVLCTYISNPETVEIALEMGGPISRLAGRIQRVEVAMRDTVIKGLKLSRAFIVVEDAVLDLPKLVREKKFRFREKGKTDFMFEVTEESINHLLDVKATKLKVRDAYLALKDGRMTFSGKVKVLFFKNHVRLDGRLFARNGTEVHFAPTGVRLDFLPIPPFLLGVIRDKMNPLADLKNFRFDVQIGTIETTRSRILLASDGLADQVHEEAARERRGEGIVRASWPPTSHSRLLAKAE